MSLDKVSLARLREVLAAAGDPWDAGITSMSILSPQEQRIRLGVKPPPGTPAPETVQPRTGTAASAASVGAPTSFFWGTPGNNNWLTPIKDQGGCGSCVAFGTTAVAETMVRISRGDPNLAVDLSEAQLFFCHGAASGASCGGGWWPIDAFNALQASGVADEACFPYDPAAAACNACAVSGNPPASLPTRSAPAMPNAEGCPRSAASTAAA